MCGVILRHVREKRLKDDPNADTSNLVFHPHVENGNYPSQSGWIARDSQKWARFTNNHVIEGDYSITHINKALNIPSDACPMRYPHSEARNPPFNHTTSQHAW